METVGPPTRFHLLMAAMKQFSKQTDRKLNPGPALEEKGPGETSPHCGNIQDRNNEEDSSVASYQPLDLISSESSPATLEVYEEKSSGISSTEVLEHEGCSIEEHLDETPHCDYDLFDSKSGKLCVDGTPYDNWETDSAKLLFDNWQVESDHMQEKHIEVDENSYNPPSNTKVQKGEFIDYLSRGGSYEWSHIFLSEEDRNKTYDKWMSDLETWERNRLMWLDQVSRLHGFDSGGDDRTFLVKVDSGYTNNTKLQRPQDSETFCQLEHTQWHKYLYDYDMGPPNWYEDLLQEQNNENVQVPGCYFDEADNSENEYHESNAQRLSQTESETFNIPHDLASVYQFTDRNLWRSYHNCFKQGKYHQ